MLLNVCKYYRAHNTTIHFINICMYVCKCISEQYNIENNLNLMHRNDK